MNEILRRIGMYGGVLLLILGTGVWLSRLGRPLNGWVLTVHKLIALGGVVFWVVQVRPLLQAATRPGWGWVILVATLLGMVLLFASGAFLSQVKTSGAWVHVLHGLASVFLVVAGALGAWLLTGGRWGLK